MSLQSQLLPILQYERVLKEEVCMDIHDSVAIYQIGEHKITFLVGGDRNILLVNSYVFYPDDDEFEYWLNLLTDTYIKFAPEPVKERKERTKEKKEKKVRKSRKKGKVKKE